MSLSNCITQKGPLGDRFRRSPRFQRIVERVHAAGARPVGELMVELLEHANADPTVLEYLHRWASIDPRVVRALGGDRFPRSLDAVPSDRKR